MAGVDIRDLSKESLPTGAFPVSHETPYRVHFAAEIHAAIHAHASENTEVEICGVVVGNWERDAQGPFARITDYIRCDQAAQKFAEVTFTHESWNHINHEMDTKHTDKRIIGWYHTHPDFGIFLSDRDGFIHQNFFSAPGQIALVVDPVRHLEGVFQWCDGKTELIPHYWVGNRIITSAAATTATRSDSGMRVGAATVAEVAAELAPASPRDWISHVTMMLSALCLLLLGFQLHAYLDQRQQRQMQLGALAHYGMVHVGVIGLKESLDESRDQVRTVQAAVKELSEQHISAAGDKSEETRKQWRGVREQLLKTQRSLDELSQRYVMSDEERELVNRMLLIKQAEILGLNDHHRAPTARPEPKPEKKPIESMPDKKSKEASKSDAASAKPAPRKMVGPEPQ